MNVELECIAKLAETEKCSFTESTSYNLTEGLTVADLVDQTKLSFRNVETVIVNNAISSTDTVFSDGDKVELVPAFSFREPINRYSDITIR